jgi:proteasome lid subunit RPN8/RPN11
MLRLTAKVIKQINNHGIASFPYEGCGVLLGSVENGNNIVNSIFPVPNRWENEEEKRVRFLISDSDMLQAELTAADQGIDVIGIFHSHPDHPPIASPRDLDWAAWSGYSYLITEVRDGESKKSRSWQLLRDRSGFVEEQLEVDDR